MQIMVINLASQAFRRERMQRLLKVMDLDYVISSGVDGRSLPDDELDVFTNRKTHGLSHAEYGCILSHVECWTRLVASEDDEALILEDDIHFSSDFVDVLRAVSIPSALPCIVKLETFYATVTLGRKFSQISRKRRLHRLYSPHGGTGSYIINRKAAQHLLSSYTNMTRALDLELFFPEKSSVKGLILYQVIPAPSIQDMVLPADKRELGDDSTIRGSRTEDKSLPSFKEGLLESFRSILRPIYRIIYSVILLPSGRKRSLIQFH